MDQELGEFSEFIKNTGMIDLCLGTNEAGQNIFAYLQIPLDCYAAYKDAVMSGATFDPETFGTVIATGPGTPPASLVAELKDKYGFWDGFEETMDELGHAVLAEINKSHA